ncbi:hypothetical protein EDB85DRAFT_1164389 [Lactarius pseudohatsudake]|nr:hypothetical protein EDB85DRAFT_1164389 [Lactarius pseudohatsudake]
MTSIKPFPQGGRVSNLHNYPRISISPLYPMYDPQVPRPLLQVGNSMWLNTMDFQNEHTAAYPNDPYPQCGPEATYENLSFDANTISRDDKALTMSSLGYAVAPVDIGLAAPMKPSPIPLAPEVGTQDVPDFTFGSPPVAPFRGDLAYQQQWWPEQHSAHTLTPEVSQGYPTIPNQEPWEYDYSLAEAMEAQPHGHGVLHLGESEGRSILRKHRYEPSYRIDGQDTRFTCTVESCGKNFSGEWEKSRHIKSMHRPPTIGCSKCNYKQSRKDLFSEHCKKRHPGESIEELRVQLDVSDA